MRTRASCAPQSSTRRAASERLRARAPLLPAQELERTIGNQAVLRLVRGATQPKQVPPAQCAPCAAAQAMHASAPKDEPVVPHEGMDEDETKAAREGMDEDETKSPHEGGETEDEAGAPAPDTDEPAECACGGDKASECSCGGGTKEESREAAPPREGPEPARPQEAGWFTGNWYTSQNTIICDGSGSLGINEATSYQYGVQDCTVQHESSHRTDWYARYGNDICKGRAKGDLPNFTPSGKESYADFLKKSECKAWKVGQKCRQEKLAACKDDACKNYVKTFTTQADAQVKSYCGT